MSVPITVAAFGTIAEAEEAVRKLIDGGVSAEIISLVAKDMQCEKQVHGFVTSCDVAMPRVRLRYSTCCNASWRLSLRGSRRAFPSDNFGS